MDCPRCRTRNSEGSRFCESCGAALTAVCPSCGSSTLRGARFCGECGKPTPPAHIAAGPPLHLASLLPQWRASLEGERKLVTIMFADIKGSLELLTARDPEEAVVLLDPVIELMKTAVHRYEGTVNQIMGDGIMALFGAPAAHEDHAARACYAALDMQDGVRALARDLARLNGPSVAIRVGLNSGVVVVRAIDNDLHMDLSAIGETTHLAARMEEMAPPGAIWLTRATLALAEPLLDTKPLGALPVRGRHAPVEVFELVGARAMRRIEVAALRGLTHFVGRELEMNELSRIQQRMLAGHGRVTAVVGEVGIGKSRLLLEFVHAPPASGCMVFETATVSYGQSVPYFPVLKLLRQHFLLAEDEPAEVVRDRIATTVGNLGLEQAVAPLQALLGVLPEDSAFATYDPLRRRELTQEALRALVLRLCALGPVLLVVEDLQWIDSESQELLDRLVQSMPSVRLHLLVNYRREYRHDWGGLSYYNQVSLDRLAPEVVDALLAMMLGDSPEIAPVKRLLIERTDGNPFFLEESVRALVDGGALVGEPGRYRTTGVATPHVPATVEGVIASRIDRLPRAEKHLLQCASVIGRDVPLELLGALANLSKADLTVALHHLQQAEFVFEQVTARDPGYSFKHSLTHEVAYRSLLHEQAKLLHGATLSAIERLYADQLPLHVDALVHHAMQGEVWPKAVDYLRQAGAAAFARGSVAESLARYEQALTFAGRLDSSRENIGRAIDVRLDLHVPLVVLGQIARLITLHEESERLARDLGDSPRLARLLYRMSQYAWIQGRFKDGLARAGQALEIATGIGDAEVRVLATYALGLNQCLLGAHREAITLFERVLDGPDTQIARRALAVTVPAYIGAACWLGYARTLVGEIGPALESTDRAAQAADESDHPQAQAIAYTMRAIPMLYQGRLDTALALCERALALCESKALLIWLPAAAGTLGWALALAGRGAEGAAHLERACSAMEATGVHGNLAHMYIWCADALLSAGRLDEAARAAGQGFDLALRQDERAQEADALHTQACIFAARDGGAARAIESYQRALEVATELDMAPLVGRCHLGLGRVYAATAEKAPARTHFDQAIEGFTRLGLQFWLAEAAAAAGGLDLGT
jgi:class 3 adenylate cyclase/tetratricopeptide (TPR) repeat protein